MLKNKIIVKKIRNIVILLMAIIIMIGAYKNIDKSRAEDVIEIGAIALDNYGYLEQEGFMLEAIQIQEGIYEIELPESVNSKKVNSVMNVVLMPKNTEQSNTETESENVTEETTTETQVVEVVENRIQLTQEQVDNNEIKLEVVYDVAILEQNQDGTYTKNVLTEKAEITEETQTLYNKIFTYEDEENGKLVEVRGYFPIDAEMQLEEKTVDQLPKVSEDEKIDISYDIKMIQKVSRLEPIDETNPESEMREIVEIVEISPESFGEVCEISITDESVTQETKIYKLNQDNTYEQVTTKENTENTMKFETSTLTTYIVTSPKEVIQDTEEDDDMGLGGDDLGISGGGNIGIDSELTGADITSPTISLGGTKVSGGAVTGETPSKVHHGGYVTNYNVTAKQVNGQPLQWRIFYTNEGALYLIAHPYLSLSEVPAVYGGTEKPVKPKNSINTYLDGDMHFKGVKDYYSGWTDGITSYMKTNWLTKYNDWVNAGNTVASTNNAMQATAYLLDTRIWNKFSDNDFAEWVIGTPPLEMYEASFNQYSSDNNLGVTLSSKIKTYYGYSIIGTGGVESELTESTAQTLPYASLDNLYVLNGTSWGASGTWLATPYMRSNSLCLVDNNGKTWYGVGAGNNYPEGNGIRPVVAIKSGVGLKDIGNNNFLLVRPSADVDSSADNIKNEKWQKSHSVTLTIQDDTQVNRNSTIQYIWTTSTTEPAANDDWQTASITWSDSDKTGTTTITKNTGTGIFYLWVRPNVTDTSGNSTTGLIRTGAFYFDNTPPTVGTINIWYDGTNTDYGGEWTNKNIYVGVAYYGTDSHSGHKSTTLSITKDGSAHVSGQLSTTLNETGIYVITVTTTDNAGNTASANKTVYIDKIAPTGAGSASATVTNQSTVTIYVSASDTGGSGLRGVTAINGWFGGSWTSTHTGGTVGYDSTNNRYYATFNFADIKDTTSGATNNGDGIYYFNAHVYDNARK